MANSGSRFAPCSAVHHKQQYAEQNDRPGLVQYAQRDGYVRDAIDQGKNAEQYLYGKRGKQRTGARSQHPGNRKRAQVPEIIQEQAA